MHHIVIVIHIEYKFDEIPFSGYVVMAPEGPMDGHGQTYIPPPSAGDNKEHNLLTIAALYMDLVEVANSPEAAHFNELGLSSLYTFCPLVVA